MSEEKENIEINKWLNRELTSEELEKFKETGVYSQYARIIEEVDTWQLPEFDVENSLSRLKQKIDSPEKEQKTKVVKFKPLVWIGSIAASIALIIGVYIAFFSTTTPIQTLVSNDSQGWKVVHLPDGSEVKLAQHASIEYLKHNWKEDKRELTLNGRAYFSVNKGSSFSVLFQNGQVQTYGTRFDVNTRKEAFSVNCYHGNIGVTFSSTNTEKRLVSHQGVSYSKYQDPSFIKFEEDEPNWLDKKMTYKETPLSLVIADIEDAFNVSIDANAIDINKKFNGWFSSDDKLEKSLKRVMKGFGIKYTVTEQKVILAE